MQNRDYIYKAIKVATAAHDGQKRKGSGLPYIVHPMECAFIVEGVTNNPEIIAAAILHDTIEDTYVTYSYLVNEFNETIANLVKQVSEDKREELPAEATWEVRKRESVKHYEKMDQRAKIVLLADKLSNLRSLKKEYDEEGEDVWNKFNMKDKEKHAWYYRKITKILKVFQNTPEYKELVTLYKEIFEEE